MRYVIGGILVLIALIIAGLIWRKKVYDEVDRLEGWKMDIMHRNVSDELSRVKALNLSGETQERFEAWRERWDKILTKELPNLEEDLFDAEEAADRYRLKKVRKVLNHSEQKLQAIEQDIASMFKELEDLLDSEKSSRQEIEALNPELKELKKSLIHSRHQFGKAARIFESRAEELEAGLKHYEELVSEGNYLEANSLVQSVREQLEVLSTEIAVFPELLRKTQKELPDQLRELHQGIEEMEEEGYRVQHLGLQPEIENYRELLKKHTERLEKGDSEDVQALIDELDPRIQEMYQELEKEALAHSYVDQHHPSLQLQLEELEEIVNQTKQDIDDLKVTYQMEEEDIESYRGIDQLMTQLKKKYLNFDKKLSDNETAFTDMRDELDIIKEQASELKEKHQIFSERVQTLRSDELEAKEKLVQIEQIVNDTDRRLKRSNLPGIPSMFFEGMQHASEHIDEVFLSLEKKQPLDMADVHQKLEEAMQHAELVNSQAKALLHQAHMAEKVIQYTNRYRSQYPLVAAKLMEAENDFRAYRYEEALERAAAALEEVEPGALSKLEEKEEVPI
ncbi:septation ring formation regulator EzrA [Halobacillus sp. Marseille-Q1614]|uniref:septation ring formation regulator EzrA n=1 Tax=Halobacillus sp. Marseille-Q1614 TaxID=2709134 RepID=UPI0015708FD9|nr:septation ring formation regulator EzrA [Halobacillus sp. Marseille-Q1614]